MKQIRERKSRNERKKAQNWRAAFFACLVVILPVVAVLFHEFSEQSHDATLDRSDSAAIWSLIREATIEDGEVTSKKLKALSLKPVRLTGYMVPNSSNGEKADFLFVPEKEDGDAHYFHAPNTVVHVVLPGGKRMKQNTEALVIQGRFDIKDHFFYPIEFLAEEIEPQR